MTEEELEKEAMEFIDDQYKNEALGKRVQTFFTYWELLGSIVEFAEPREKRIAELEAQIEKMKCCANCKHFNFNEPNYCHKGVYRERQYVCSEWECGN